MSPLTEKRRDVRVLLVEDNPADVDLAMEALEDNGATLHLGVAADGVEALRMIRSEPPDLVLLDLNLPRKNGREVLAEMKADPRLRHIPVVVLTSSDAARDVLATYELGASCYVTKPVGLRAFQTIVVQTARFWTNVVTLPSPS